MRSLETLFKTPRMYYAELSDNNSVEGLYDMIKEIGTKDFSIVEIGCFAGVSSELFAQNCKELICVDGWLKGSKGLNNEQLTYAWNEFKKMEHEYENLITIQDYSKNVVSIFADDSIDMVYIDAVHDYEDVLEDIKLWMPKVRKGGYICGHDIHMDGVKKAVEEMFGNDYKIYKDTSWMHKK